MYRILIALIILSASALHAFSASPQASDTISIKFSLPGDIFLQQLMQYQGIYAISVSLASDQKCEFTMEMVKSDHGTISRNPLYVYPTELSPDTTVINFMSAPYRNDSIKIGTRNVWDIIEAYPNALLIEALPLRTYTSRDTIPLAIYSQGIEREINFRGKNVKAYDICGVRYSKKHPSEWGKEFNIDKYLWFELVPAIKKE